MRGKQQGTERQPVKFPSAYRYLGLGLLLPVLVFIGMIIGYDYGASFGEFYSAIFAAIGSVTGLIIATVVIVKITLHWDKRILRALKSSRRKRSKYELGKS